jgi:hypothetical protein
MAIRILEDNGGLLIRVADEDGMEFWMRKSRLQPIGGGAYDIVTERRAKELRTAYARAEERKRKKAVAEANRELETECSTR